MYRGYVTETIALLDKHIGKTVSQLFSEYGIITTSKSKLQSLCLKMMDLEGKNTVLSASGIILKTVRTKENGRVQESMSFPTFRFDEIIKENWLDSSFRLYLIKHVFLFAVFEKNGDNLIFKKYFVWKPEIELIDGPFFEVWHKTKELISSGNIVKEVKNKENGKIAVITNFPGLSFNGVCHVRPHAQNAYDVYKLPVPDKTTGLLYFTKQCFWINNTFIYKLLEKE